MKLLKLTFLLLLPITSLFAQSKTAPVITDAFSDSLKVQIPRIAPTELSIKKITYVGNIAADGKVMKALIMRQEGGGSEAEAKFVVTLRALILAAPAWKPAFDTASNTAVEDEVKFTIELKKGDVKIKQDK
ncbi:hypothetical protein D0C36_11585 [Mucilaginibacter conchicola]|uniref:TonB C-terminal domain-containing protein n=1 Tax=Mucilaginibacter conchicola TaxID=2303333 RepID=A0A372NSH6_9SPHI|nr:hypothetical protein [Mucilaginibacter conchicola]RFZ92082.1 hypothetical protein D0C36_11585 [Mucilaginibacter conchicola]